jgi:hypothetical protein
LHPLPTQEYLEYLVGSEMGQIIIDPFQVRFVLSGVEVAAQIAVSEPFIYYDGKIEDVFAPDDGSDTQAPIRFHALLRQKLLELSVSSDGAQLVLRFEKGQTLTIRSDLGGPYESGTISGRNGLWVF